MNDTNNSKYSNAITQFLSCKNNNVLSMVMELLIYKYTYTTNVKNMHPHRDSNPGPWITVPML